MNPSLAKNKSPQTKKKKKKKTQKPNQTKPNQEATLNDGRTKNTSQALTKCQLTTLNDGRTKK